MFRSKKDVDAHVRDVFSKCISESERLKLCFGVARQYAGIKEFDSARRYLETFVAANPANPANFAQLAEAHKFLGDVHQELGDNERALESYKVAYTYGKGKDALNRVCDLITRGIGAQETTESKKHWMDLQKSSANSNSFTPTGNSPAMPQRTLTPVGPPKIGFGHHAGVTNGNSRPLISSANKTNGGNVDLQLRYLERRFDDGLGKILDQNTMVLEQMLRLKEDMKDLADKMEHIALSQQKLQEDVKEIQDKDKNAALVPQLPQRNSLFNEPSQKCKCEDRSNELKTALNNLSSTATSEYSNLKGQMEKLEKLTQKAIDNYNKDAELRIAQAHAIPAPRAEPIASPIPRPLNSNATMMTTNQPQTQPFAQPSDLPMWKLGISDPKLSGNTKPEYSWKCGTCNTTNLTGGTQCVACNLPRSGIIKNEPTLPTVQPKLNFGFSSANPITPPSLKYTSNNTTGTPTMSQSLATNKSTVDGVAPRKLEEEKASPFAGLPLNTAGKFSFADLAQNNNSSFTFGIGGGETPSFAGAGAPIFSSSNLGNKTNTEEQKTPKESTVANTSASADDGEDDFVPTVEFQPVIPLPPLVEVRKGDENENTIVEYRAKLYRFVSETKEWKERGVGNIKLLQCKDDPNKCRVVMWREKVGKLACNFNLFPDIKVTNNPTNLKALCWKCQDFAEDPSWETFTLKFGNEENCAHFKQEMERLAKLTSATSDSPKKQSSPTAQPLSSQTNGPAAVGLDSDKNKNPSTVPLSQLFKKPEGSWNCGACYCSNSKDLTICPACQTCRPGFENTVKEEPTTGTVQPTFSFGFPTAKPVTPPTLNFGFNNSVTVAPVQGVDSSTAKKPDENKDSPFAGLNLSSNFSFADVAKNNNPSFTFGGVSGGEAPSFAATGTGLFSSLNLGNTSTTGEQKTSEVKVSNAANTSTNADDGEDDFVPTVEFQPVIPLPPLVEVRKGDENENTIAEYRTKLYRFVSETKEWKERGVGNIKLLQSKNDPNKCRVVMWREKIGKLACNFNLFPDIKVTNYQNSPKVLCWKCQDFAEDPSWETFTLKFGNEENCSHFKQEMERLAKLTSATSESPKKDSPTAQNLSSQTNGPAAIGLDSDNNKNPSTVPLSQLFKKPEGSWNCGACYCSNSKDLTICPACQTCRPGFENTATEEAPTGAVQVQPTFSFGFPTAKPVTPPTLNFGFNNNASVTAAAPTTVVDGGTVTTSNENKDPSFPGNLSDKFTFADLAKTNNNSSFADLAKSNTPGFTFGGEAQSFAGAGAPLFASINANNRSSSEEKPPGVGTTANTSAHAEDGEDDFVPTVEFQPVIPLPPLVEVKKGDENENLIVEYRAKLYRFVPEAKEWKERGIGNIKLLQSKNDPNKCRVVMWREKIGKLACNFSLYPDIIVTNFMGNPKVLCWKCQDYAEDSIWETFTLRFGNEDNCEDFKNKLMEYAQGSGSANASGVSFTEADTSSSCPGCAGCDVDSYQFPQHKQDSEEAIIDIPLAADASTASPFTVSLNFFDRSGTSPQHNNQTTPTQQQNEELEVKSDASNKSSNMSSFSFSLQTPEKNSTSSPISFQFKTPSFSFKSPEGNSPSIFGGAGGGSIFSPIQGTPASGAAPSPFTSPFGQKLADNSNSAPPVSSPFSFSQSNFLQSPPQANAAPDDGENEGERQEEDEYEDVDDEDECMFEDDAHIYIQDDSNSSQGFSDKGEGVVRVLYDGESYCARLVILVNDETVAEHLVAVETLLEPKDDRTYEWTGVCNYESPVKSRIKVTFSNDEAYQNFSTVMCDGLEFAEQAGITENVLMEDSSGY